MNMYVTEHEVQIVFRAALIRIANVLNIQDIEWKANQELYDEIRILDSEFNKPLDNFLSAYREWYQYHYERKDKLEFDHEENIKLTKLISDRDRFRSNLIDILNSKGC